MERTGVRVELGVGADPTAVAGQVDPADGGEVLVELVGEGAGTQGEGPAAEGHDVGGDGVGGDPPVAVSDRAARVELHGVDHPVPGDPVRGRRRGDRVRADLEIPAGQARSGGCRRR